MNNFEFYNPVRVLFGEGQIAKIVDLLPDNGKILLVYGGGSIKMNGVYDQVLEVLSTKSFVEFGGIKPNPEYEFLLPAIDLVKSENIEFILAVGGGSVVVVKPPINRTV